jgi:ABC-type transporter Mla MlaB component
VTTRLEHALEVSERSATLYLTGALSAADAFPLRRICREIPERVRTLRLDLHGVDQLDDSAMETVRAVVRYWKHSRGGNFRLAIATQHLVATISDDESRPAPPTLLRVDSSNHAALMGTYL